MGYFAVYLLVELSIFKTLATYMDFSKCFNEHLLNMVMSRDTSCQLNVERIPVSKNLEHGGKHVHLPPSPYRIKEA